MFYKIVDSEYRSFNSSLYRDSVSCIQYKKMKWAKPKHECAPLYVFDSLDSANDFIDHISIGLILPIKANYRIFECIIEKSNIKWGFCSSPTKIESNIDLYYNDYFNYNSDISKWPKGTVFANKVMLIKNIKNKPKKLYYKVVDHNLESVSGESRKLNLCVKYKTGEWTIPDNPIAPLMVFDNLEDATDFCYNPRRGGCQVYSCDIIKSRRKWGYLYSKDWDNYIKAKLHKKKFNFIDDLPEGTIFADAVKLIKVVYNVL